MSKSYTVVEARRHFSDLIAAAQNGDHPAITRHGQQAAVIVGADWYRKTTAAAAAGETIQPLDGIIRLAVSVDSDIAFNLLKAAYQRTGRREGGEDAGRVRLEAIKGIMADALAEYLDRHETTARDAAEVEAVNREIAAELRGEKP